MSTEKQIKKILIAEDDLALWPLWDSFFNQQKDPVDLYWTVSCEEAIKMVDQANAEKDAFDLIITDIFLAGSGTGMELLISPEVKESRARKLLVSVVDRKDIIEKYGDVVSDAEVVSKPFDMKRYAPIIENLLRY
ncbi:MAG: hypothetical protein ACXVAX_13325 [Pseudobdellovibrio sp.]